MLQDKSFFEGLPPVPLLAMVLHKTNLLFLCVQLPKPSEWILTFPALQSYTLSITCVIVLAIEEETLTLKRLAILQIIIDI